MERYEVGKLLGQGTFAKVHHARNLKTGTSVAIKIIDKEKIFKVGMMEQITREVSVMKMVRHPNVVQLYEVMASKTKIYFVMEYAKGGELFEKIAQGRMKSDVARKYFQQLISAVDFCHSRGISHRDLKPENLLLDEDGNLKITDFGLSALSESKRQDGLLHTICGTPAYVSPEVINRQGYEGAKADIWSCGVILFVLLSGYLPFRDQNLMEMYRKIRDADFKFPKWFSSDACKLISRILDPNPKTRIPISKIMTNAWFRKGFHSKPSQPNEESTDKVSEKSLLLPLTNLNAFDIISYSWGFDLSGLFDNDEKRESRFTSTQPAKTIISKLEDVAKQLKLKITKKEGGFLRLEGLKRGRKGVLSIDAEIFEVTPAFHMVEMKKSDGDTLEYKKIMKQEIRPALKDIAWVWHGDEQKSDGVNLNSNSSSSPCMSC